MVIKSKIQCPICRVSNTNQQSRSPYEQSECQISHKFPRPLFWTSTSNTAVLDLFVKFVLATYFPAPRGSWNFLESLLTSLKHGARGDMRVWAKPRWYVLPLLCCFSAVSPGSVFFFCFSPLVKYVFSFHHTIIHKCYISITATAIKTSCHSKSKPCPECS